MKKNLLLAFAAVCALSASAQEFTVNGITFNVLDEEAATVEIAPGDYNGKTIATNGTTTTVTYNDKTYNIVAIGKNAFRNATVAIGTGVAWFDANIAYIGENAFTGTTIASSNTLTASANRPCFRGTTVNWHPKAFVGNNIRSFQFLNDARYMNFTETQNLGGTSYQHVGVVMSKDHKPPHRQELRWRAFLNLHNVERG